MNDKSNIGTPYDDAFHTMVQRAPELLIPLVNEVFQENFQRNAEVIVQSSDLPSVDGKNGVLRRFSDSLFSIKGAETKLFHVECESKPDGSIVIRMVEYGFHKALRDARYEEGELIVEMPNSAVIFLRHHQHTPDYFRVRIATPGGDCCYPIQVLKVGQYSLEDIFEKELLFLLPFHVFAYEKDLPAINDDPERLSELVNVYQSILKKIEKLCENGNLSTNSEELLHSMMRHVLNGVARNYDKVRKVGDTMLGRVIDDDFTRMLDKMNEARVIIKDTETKLNDIESKLSDAETKLGETETKLGETETKLTEAERKAELIQSAVEYLSRHGRTDQIIKIYEEPDFLETVLHEIG